LGVLGQSGLPTPGGSAAVPAPPSTAAVNRTLKRTSNQAGLPTPGPAYKRSITPSIPSTPSNKLASLRHDLEATSTATTLQRQLNSTQRENGQLMRELGSLQERVKQLEKERAILISREEKFTFKESERDLQREEERRTLVSSLGEFRQRYAVLEEENDSLRSENSRLKHAHDIMKEEKDVALKQMEVLQDELQKLDEENHTLKNSEDALKAANERIPTLKKELQERPSSSSNAAAGGGNASDAPVSDVLRKELHHQVQHLRTLEQNNARLTKELAVLKKDKANVELLKEEKLSLESRIRRMDALRRNLADVEGEVAILKRERDEWAVYLKSTQTETENTATEKFETPAQLTRTLASARIEIASLQEKLESSAANLRLRDQLMNKLEARVQELESEILPQYKRETEALRRRLENLERMRNLDQKELGMLREQIQSYAIEESQLMASTSSRDGDVKPNLNAYDDQKTLQIQHLHDLLDAQKVESTRIAKELDQTLAELAEVKADTSAQSLINTNGDETEGFTAKQGSLRQALSEQVARNEELQECKYSSKAHEDAPLVLVPRLTPRF
jgi:mitotic spindle assembly checkpoint protein MAD1